MEGNAREKRVTVQFDSQVASLEDIKEAMARIGYDAEMMQDREVDDAAGQ